MKYLSLYKLYDISTYFEIVSSIVPKTYRQVHQRALILQKMLSKQNVPYLYHLKYYNYNPIATA